MSTLDDIYEGLVNQNEGSPENPTDTTDENIEETNQETTEQVDTTSPDQEETTETEETTTEEEAKPEETTEETPEVIEDWYSGEEETTDIPKDNIIEELGTTASEFKAQVEKEKLELERKLSEQRKHEEELTQLRDKLKDLEKQKEYDAYTDHTRNKSDYTVVEENVAKYYDTTTELGKEKVQAYMDSLTDDQVEFEARKVRQSVQHQIQQQALYDKQQAIREEQLFMQSLDNTLNNTNQISGYKLQESNKSNIKKIAQEGDLMKHLFGDANGKPSPDKIVEVLFKVHNFDNIVNFHKTKAANETKREIVNNMSNVDPHGGRREHVQQNTATGMDAWMNQLKNNNNGSIF